MGELEKSQNFDFQTVVFEAKQTRKWLKLKLDKGC